MRAYFQRGGVWRVALTRLVFSARSTRDMFAKVQAFYGSDDVRETVFLRPDLLHGSTAKLMVGWAADRDEREKRKPKKKKKAAAKEEEESDEDESDDDDFDDDVIDIEDSDEEDTPEEVAQAAQEASTAARRAAEAFKEMGLPAPRRAPPSRVSAAPCITAGGLTRCAQGLRRRSPRRRACPRRSHSLLRRLRNLHG